MSEDGSMMSNQDRLIYMANQIARNLETLGEYAASKAVADHIARFWDPRMRAQIFALQGDGTAALSPIANQAITLLRHAGRSPQTGVTEFHSVDRIGHSDASR